MRVLLAVLLFFSFSVSALTDHQVETQYRTRLEPFYKRGVEVNFRGEKGVQLVGRYFLHPEPSPGTIVIANGFGETFHKYVEVAYDLYARGYSVFLYDHRGQGLSQHLLADPRRGYIDDFEFMIADLKTYFEGTVKRIAPAPYFLIGHSMGGMVSARYLEEHTGDFTAAVLSSPMLGINLGGLGLDPAKWILDAIAFFGYDQFYVQGPSDPLLDTFATQSMTHDKIRFGILDQKIRALHPEALIWGPTARWVDQSIHAGLDGLKDPGQARTPMLLFQAGTDTEVLPDPEGEFCAKAASCRLVHFAGSNHEILMEKDSIRESALAQIIQYFESFTLSAMNEH